MSLSCNNKSLKTCWVDLSWLFYFLLLLSHVPPVKGIKVTGYIFNHLSCLRLYAECVTKQACAGVVLRSFCFEASVVTAGWTVEIRGYDGKSMQEAAAMMKRFDHAHVWEGSECDRINL